ncbi:MAG: MFS transporter [Verrucomicrobiaceae bacterium]|nr:MFS transporter [Verrucomicrobiaceae bacterium]
MSDSSPAAPSFLPLVLRGSVLALISAAFGWLVWQQAKMGFASGCVVGGAIFGIGLFALMKLADAPRGLWVTLGLKMVIVTAYKLLTIALTTWAMKDLGLGSSQAQWVFSAWGMCFTLATLVSGSLTDAIGMRRTLLLGVSLAVVCRLVMFASTNAWVALACGMVPAAIAEAFCTPVLVAATRKFTAPEQRSVAFSIFYAIMNTGFLVGYFFHDAVFSPGVLPLNDAGMVSVMGMQLSRERVLIFVSLAVEILILPLLLLLRGDTNETGTVQTSELGQGMLMRGVATVQNAARDTGRQLALLVRQPRFGRLLVFLAMIGLLKIVFGTMDSVLPTFAEREIGADGRACVGRMNSVNSVLILVLAPLIGVITRKRAAYSMVILGGFVTAASFVFMALPGSMFTGFANGWLGDAIGHGYLGLKDVVHPYIVMIVLWQVAFSIGEAIYSPRVYEYAASMAPKGQEASFASLSYVPLLMGKFATGALFGGLLEHYCPPVGARDPGGMWMIVGGLVLMAPLLLLVLRPFIRMKEEGKE